MMFPSPRTPSVLGMTRETGVTLALLCSIIALLAVVMTVLIFGLDETSTPLVVTIAGTFGLIANTLISALKATEAADTASKTKNVAELSASKTAVLQQALTDHFGHICPRDDCPFRQAGGTS